MRYPPDQKAKTRKSIVEAAGRVFRRQGYAGGGVDAVMKEAGLTHGGFYAHFRSKEDLFAEALLESLRGMLGAHGRWTEGLEGMPWLRAFTQAYLSEAHAAHMEQGCPAAALISELGRVGDGPKASFSEGLAGWAESISPQLGAGLPAADRQRAALGLIAACVGGLTLARAVDDPELRRQVLRGASDLVIAAFAPAEEGIAPVPTDHEAHPAGAGSIDADSPGATQP
ncbi:MAG: TetR/AcrR family transcriptional regulator [Holophagales bacterium]|nr:TetR/AcrR family transcriptional regulator [Holophagales bacterium]